MDDREYRQNVRKTAAVGNYILIIYEATDVLAQTPVSKQKYVCINTYTSTVFINTVMVPFHGNFKLNLILILWSLKSKIYIIFLN